MNKRAFYDRDSRVLKCWGFVETNNLGDLWRDVPEDYVTEVGTVKLNAAGDGDEPYTPPPPAVLTREQRATAAYDALTPNERAMLAASVPDATDAQRRERFIAAYPG